MWETLGTVIKVFVEKHLIPTITSLIISIVIFLLTPEDSEVLLKLGKLLYIIFIAGIVFLVIELIRNVIFNIIKGVYHIENKNQYDKQQEIETEDAIDNLFTYVDGLVPEERDLILSLVKNNNQPITENVNSLRLYESTHGSIYNTNHIVSTINRDGTKKIKLNDKFYQIVKEVYQRTGHISHFD